MARGGRGSGRRSKRRPTRRPEPPRTGERPAPPERARPLWGVFSALGAILVVVAWARVELARPDVVYSGDFVFHSELPPDSSVVVTPPFELAGRTSSVEVAVSTDLDDAWVYFNYALIEQRTGKAIEFGQEVKYFRRTSTARSGTGVRHTVPYVSGSRDAAVRVPTVPAGQYVLRIEPEGSTPVLYGVRVRRDVAGWEFYAVAFLLLLVPPAFASLGGRSGRGRR